MATLAQQQHLIDRFSHLGANLLQLIRLGCKMSRSRRAWKSGHDDPFYKTTWCDFVGKKYGCKKGEYCRHAHTWDEFRPQFAGADPGSNWSQASVAAGYNDQSLTTRVQDLEHQLEVHAKLNERLRADIERCCAENELLRAENESLRAEKYMAMDTDDPSSQTSTRGDIPNGVATENMPEEEPASRVVRHAEFLKKWKQAKPLGWSIGDHPKLKEQMMYLMFHRGDGLQAIMKMTELTHRAVGPQLRDIVQDGILGPLLSELQDFNCIQDVLVKVALEEQMLTPEQQKKAMAIADAAMERRCTELVRLEELERVERELMKRRPPAAKSKAVPVHV